MILDIAFEFGVQVVPKGKRTPEPVTLRSSVAIHVEEFSTVEAPVAAWWTPPHSGSTDGKVPGPRTAIRRLPDHLAQPLYSTGAIAGDAAFVRPGPRGEAPVMLADIAAGVHVEAFLAGESWGCAEPKEVPRRSSLPSTSRVVEDGEESMASQIRRFASGLALVAGVLHRRIAMPVLEADMFERKARAATLDQYLYDPTRVYRLDQWDLATAQGAREARTPGPPAPEVLMPDAFAFDEALVMATGTAKAMVDIRIHRRDRPATKPEHFPAPLLEAWIDVRDAYQGGHDAPALLAALARMENEMRGRRLHGLDHESEMLTRCIERTATLSDDADLALMAL